MPFIHLIGKASGAVPEEPAVAALLATCPDFGTRLTPLAAHLAKPQPGFSYTHWEAYLAISKTLKPQPATTDGIRLRRGCGGCMYGRFVRDP